MNFPTHPSNQKASLRVRVRVRARVRVRVRVRVDLADFSEMVYGIYLPK